MNEDSKLYDILAICLPIGLATILFIAVIIIMTNPPHNHIGGQCFPQSQTEIFHNSSMTAYKSYVLCTNGDHWNQTDYKWK